ncbi:MAG: hypothetical protein GY832_02360 [Chloroflexi bacterium]|nr:hypothetical protein [Chloroflexota bacterium]
MTQHIQKKRSKVLMVLVSFFIAIFALLLVVGTMTVAAQNNLLQNGDFEEGTASWSLWGGDYSVTDGVFQIAVDAGHVDPWDGGVEQAVGIVTGTRYFVALRARADRAITVPVALQEAVDPWTGYFYQDVPLSTTMQTYAYTFVSDYTDPAALFNISLGALDAFTMWVEYVVLEPYANLVTNGDFEDGTVDPWWSGDNTVITVTAGGELHVTVTGGGIEEWEGGMGQSSVGLVEGGIYKLSFDARANQTVTPSVLMQQPVDPWAEYLRAEIPLTTITQTYEYAFEASTTDSAGQLFFVLGGLGSMDVWLDNVVIEPWNNGLEAGDFEDGIAPWFFWDDVSAVVDNGMAVITSTGTSGAFERAGTVVAEGSRYVFVLQARASEAITVPLSVQLNVDPYTEYLRCEVPLTTEMQTHVCEDVISDYTDESAAFVFMVGDLGPFTMWVDEVRLETRGVPVEPEPPVPPLAVRVNQVGYLPGAAKRASIGGEPGTLLTPLLWEVVDSTDTVVLSGTTELFGFDTASGQDVHIADFSDLTATGVYTLRVGNKNSYPFEIGASIYQTMTYDALSYFYYARSGTPVTMPYAGNAEWTHPAGHLSLGVNDGDYDVPCFDGTEGGVVWSGACTNTLGLTYTLNVTGGWYDAGDYGKYMVPGGFATYLLLNQYERSQHVAYADAAAFDDGTMNIPENDNDVPDLLDEARWEIEFLLKMQVPDGATIEMLNAEGDGTYPDSTLAGMVHHKIHGEDYDTWAVGPDQDATARHLYPPSTAATLHLAAIAGQAARIWETIDPVFSAQCLAAAEKAWQAAVAHPELYFPGALSTGGGDYGDTRVTDEFYWAAAELFITTGEQEYLDYLLASPHFLDMPYQQSGEGFVSMVWPDSGAFGTMSLLVVPNTLTDTLVLEAAGNLLSTADRYLDIQNSEGHLVPYRRVPQYPWGSSYYVLNNTIIIGLAYDLTGDEAYLNGVSESMDYILGRNPLAKSYVSGHGEDPLQNPHHAFWASLSGPPPGVLAGGPYRGGGWDPTAAAELQDCVGQTCYIDHVDSWSTNEVTIYWNASLAWVASFLNENQSFQTPVTFDTTHTEQVDLRHLYPATYTVTYQTVVHAETDVISEVYVTYTLDSELTAVDLTRTNDAGTVHLPPTTYWYIDGLSAGETITLTLVTTGTTQDNILALLTKDELSTQIVAYDGQATRGPWILETDLLKYKVYLPVVIK